MEFSINIPLDADGFLPRECPSCFKQFKWFGGQSEMTPEDWEDPDRYYCPYCVTPAEHDSWWTQDQLDFAQGVASRLVHDELLQELKRSAKRARNDLFKIEVEGDSPGMPGPLHEADGDMAMVEPPCHPFEPLKVLLDDQPVHCLVCGAAFGL